MTEPTAPPRPRLPGARPAGLADFGACLLLVGWLAHSWRFIGLDPDLFWHIKYGQLFMQARGLDVADDFAWTVPNAQWLDHEWGGEVLFAWIFATFGLDALPAFRWLIFAATLALAVRMFVRGGLPFAPAAVGAVMLHVLLHGQALARMQNFTVALMLVTAYVLQGWWLHRRLDAVGWAFPLIVVVWANLHGGGALAGAGSCGVVLAAEIAARWRSRRWAELGPLVYLAVGSGLALFVNPHGWHMPALSLAMLFDPAAKAVNAQVNEWLRPDLRDPATMSSVIGLATIGTAGLLSRRSPSLGMAAFALIWLSMACLSRRNTALASMAILPLAIFWLAAVRLRLERWAAPSRRAAVGLFLAACVAASWLSPQARYTSFTSATTFPSADALEVVVALAPTHRMFNLYEWGGLLIFVGHPPLKVFIDGRGYPYGPELLREAGRMLRQAPGWDQLFAKHRIDMVVIPPTVLLAHALATSPGWRVAFEDPTAVVFVKR